ncbi:MAG: hypothetical protein RKU31_45775 [Deltaproteobacteria bacterium]|jgi:hypothetical protein
MDLVKENNIQHKSPNGWRNIGRSLVVVVVGSDALARVFSKDPDVVVIHFDGIPKNVHELRAFSPSVVDVAVLDATTLPRGRMVKLAQSLRHRLLASVILLPSDSYGEAMFRRWLGVVKEERSPWMRYLWMSVAVAAQETWALGWVTMTRSTAKNVMQAPSLPKSDEQLLPRPPSRTAPFSPTPEMLAMLAEAYQE